MMFMCGQKKKFGLNMQAACDARCCFVDVTINTPGATSDFLSFEMSSFQMMIEMPNLAYAFLAMQHTILCMWLHRKIACAFCMHVHQGAILCMPIPCNVSIVKHQHWYTAYANYTILHRHV